MADAYVRSLEQLQRLRCFSGEPAEFWNGYLHALVAVAEAEGGLIALRDGRVEPPWRIVALVPQSLKAGLEETLLAQMDSAAAGHEETVRFQHGGRQTVAVRLQTGSDADTCLALLLLERSPATREIQRRLQLVADVPASYQLQRVAAESRTRVEQFATVLDLMEVLNREKRFLAAAMTFCNELASGQRCERVSLGWLDRGYVRLQAISHVDHFDRKTEAVQMLEAAMEESLDQDTEVCWPESHGGGAIRRDHQSFARAHDVGHLCSLPLRVEAGPTAVCTCERAERPFSETEMRLLRLACDHAARRLSDLKRSDRWLGARMAGGLKEALGRLLGYEHTWSKVIAILAAALLGFLVFGRAPYRLKAPVILRTDDVAYLTAPFAGHIEQVGVRVGDLVNRDQGLLALDQTQLTLREAELIAEQNRYLGEIDKARAQNAPADMRISRALYEQAAARHELVRYQLARSQIRAPFEGVIVEGDLMENIGSPVEQGQVLFKLARIDRLYAELEVNEQDVHELTPQMQGRIALASRPQETYAIRLWRMEPVAVPKEKGNVFLVQAQFPAGVQPWWRPGMTGVARLEAGERRLLWILTHRTVEFLRLRLWW